MAKVYDDLTTMCFEQSSNIRLKRTREEFETGVATTSFAIRRFETGVLCESHSYSASLSNLETISGMKTDNMYPKIKFLAKSQEQRECDYPASSSSYRAKKS